MLLNVFACFCNISFVFLHVYAFMRLCVALPLRHALAPCMVHGIGVHVMHHIIVMFIIMLIMFIVVHHHVHHHVHRSLIDH